MYKLWSQFLTWFGDLYLAWEPPLTRAEHIRIALDKIKPGMVVFRGYLYYLDAIAIPGEYSHSSIYIGDNKVVHSIAEGCKICDLLDFIKDTDRFLITNPMYKTEELKKDTINLALDVAKANVPYDFLFNDDGKLYCHEMTVRCLNEAGIHVQMTLVKKLFFKKYFYLAQNIINVSNKVYEFDGEKSITY